MSERAAELTELHPWESKALDIAGCDRTEIVVPLNEFEKAGARPESWPDAVMRLAYREAERWIDQHKETRGLRAISYGAPSVDGRQVCVLILHHSPKRG